MAHGTGVSTQPTQRQGSVSARSRGGGGQPDSTVGEVGRGWRLGQHGEMGNSERIVSPKRALGGSGGSVEELIDTRRVAPVVRLVGTGASWWSSRMEQRHRTRN
jgi:hypothetical protein